MSIPPCSDLQILDIYPLNHWKKYIVLDRYFVLVCNFIVVWTKLPKKKRTSSLQESMLQKTMSSENSYFQLQSTFCDI